MSLFLQQVASIFLSPIPLSSFLNYVNPLAVVRLILAITVLMLVTITIHVVTLFMTFQLLSNFRVTKDFLFVTGKSIFISFLLAKVLQQIFLLVVNLIPLIGPYLYGSSQYAFIVIMLITECFLMRNELDMLAEKELLIQEITTGEIVIGISIATIITLTVAILTANLYS